MMKPRIIDLKGKRFGRWRVVGGPRKKRTKNYSWLCRCDCGNEKWVIGQSLRKGASKSCGCMPRRNAAPIADLSRKKIRKGFVNPKTGLVFVRYFETGGVTRESWVTAERYARLQALHKKRNAKYRLKNRKKVRQISMAYYERHREVCNKRQTEWNKRNKEQVNRARRKWRKLNPDKSKEQRRRDWLNRDKEKHNASRRRYLKKRKAFDPLFRLATNIRSKISTALKNAGYSKNTTTEKIVGCSFRRLKEHLEKLFRRGMTWKNYGEWHVDHLVPLASATTEEDIICLNHYSNLRPLWGEENLSKHAKMPSKGTLEAHRTRLRSAKAHSPRRRGQRSRP
jgi:hypothetical protein